MRGRRMLAVGIGPLLALGALLMAVTPVAAAGVVGTGTAASCDEAAFNAAFAGGGTVTFNCGPAPVTITFTSTKTLTADTTVDGAGLVTLSGGDTVRLFESSGFDLTLDGLVLRDATAGGFGSAVRVENAILAIVDSTVSDNAVGGYGTVAVEAFDGAEARLAVVRSTFANNSSGGHAGTIYANAFTGNPAGCTVPSAVHVLILNSTFTGNTADGGGSVLWADAPSPFCDDIGEVQILYSTFAGNTGATVLFAGPGTTVDVAGNVIGPNSSGCLFLESGSESLGYNVTDQASCLPGGAVTGDQVVADTMLGPLADNGGLTQTMALLAGSPALDVIPPGTVECGAALTEDQRGFTRPQGTNCDAGAYEQVVLPPPPTPVASGLPDAAMPVPSSPMSAPTALAFGVLLLAALGTLAVARIRRR